MADRLKLLPKIIPHWQFDFVKCRFILDNVILAKKILYKLQKAKVENALMVLKLDLNKANDKISRKAIIEVMRSLASATNGAKW